MYQSRSIEGEISDGYLTIGGGSFLLPKEETRCREVLERHGRDVIFCPSEIGCANLTFIEIVAIFINPRVTKLKVKFSLKAPYTKVNRFIARKVSHGYMLHIPTYGSLCQILMGCSDYPFKVKISLQ